MMALIVALDWSVKIPRHWCVDCKVELAGIGHNGGCTLTLISSLIWLLIARLSWQV